MIQNDEEYFEAINTILATWQSAEDIHVLGYAVKNYAAIRWPRQGPWPVTFSESPTLLVTQDLSYVDFPFKD